jgi:hypothetical protein
VAGVLVETEVGAAGTEGDGWAAGGDAEARELEVLGLSACPSTTSNRKHQHTVIKGVSHLAGTLNVNQPLGEDSRIQC